MNKVSALPESADNQGKRPSDIIDEDDVSTPRDEVSPTENNEDPSAALTSAAPKPSLLDVDWSQKLQSKMMH
ncbi:hypothetical protein QTG54_005233 [Skeletonema marinoi]|uniref:Uncharacterized protein n=1 Tax=Skeletonema marinoi TaxID=267567 RepID=A0AAD9DDH4_9STRA|nr:hypothetical protein QTG54_005233 [Skeletonema marinoi]